MREDSEIGECLATLHHDRNSSPRTAAHKRNRVAASRTEFGHPTRTQEWYDGARLVAPKDARANRSDRDLRGWTALEERHDLGADDLCPIGVPVPCLADPVG